MKDYYNVIVELSSKLCYKDDYGVKKKVKEHNKAMTKLNRLDQEMNNPEGKQVLLELLYHTNDQVILSAAMLCLKLKFNLSDAKKRIAYVRDESSDSIVSFNAEMMLKSFNNN